MVEITSVQFTDEYTGTAVTKNDFLMGSIGDLYHAYTTIAIHWESLTVLCSFDSVSKTITRNDNRSWLADGFRNNDTFDIVNGGANTGSFTIVTVSDREIVTVEPLVTATSSGVDFHGTTPVTTIDFYFNLIENAANVDFMSLTDIGTLQKRSAYKASWANTDSVTMTTKTVSKGWFLGGAGTTTKVSTTDYAQIFLIDQIIGITPLFLSGQQDGFATDPLTSPPYFNGGNCLKFVCRADAKFEQNSPQIVHSTDINYPFQYGNTGWFDEFLNGGDPEYTLSSVSYQDVVSGDTVTQPDLNKTTQVTMVVDSASGNFTDVVGITPGSQVVIGMCYAPLDQADYVNTRTILRDNFRLDRLLTTVGAASANGVGFGTDRQTLTGITATFVSANQITITFTIDLATAYKTFLQTKSSSNWNYIFWATPQKLASTYLGDTDRNAVLGDFNSFIYNKDDSTLLTWYDSLFFQYPDTTNNYYTDFKGMIGDNVLTRSKFTISSGATPKDLTAEIRVVNSVTGESFTLQTYTQQFPETELNGIICSKNVPTVLGYNLSVTDVRNQAYLYRNTAIDTPTQYGWEFDYGFVTRYETWRDLPDYPTAFSCDHTQDWSTYSLQPNWEIKFIVTVNVTQNDYTTTFERTSDITLQDGDYSDDGFGGQIVPMKQTFYYSGSNLVDAKGLIFYDQNTHVTLTYTGDFSALPTDAIGYSAYIALDIEGTGGEKTRDIAPSETDPIEGSAWATRAMITKVDNATITVEADIDYTKLNLTVKEYLITGRFMFKY